MTCCALTVKVAAVVFDALALGEKDAAVAEKILHEIRRRLGFLTDVGLDYLTLERLSSTLSGGESQRINLATSLGSALVDTLYVLDEPSIGLHPRDNERLIAILLQLRDQGNTVIVVEHDADMIRVRRPGRGHGTRRRRAGRAVIYSGSVAGLLKDPSR
jgi:excinuclease ABC subunit A